MKKKENAAWGIIMSPPKNVIKKKRFCPFHKEKNEVQDIISFFIFFFLLIIQGYFLIDF